jgi:N-acetyl-1-D-myo-inositol-2-amino-2-deoxy-alpha-D-glucopyranoside deacetylase
VIRETRPQVLVTYDETGGYGHPDHIMAHRVAMAAAERAGAPGGAGKPWQIAKIYWSAIPKSVLQAGIDLLKAQGDESNFFGVDSAEDLPFGNPDDEVTTAIEASEHAPAKNAAMRAHATQISVDGPFFALSNGIGRPVLGTEYFRLIRGPRGTDSDADGRETSLFGGLDADGPAT